jgi:hypothetical protein
MWRLSPTGAPSLFGLDAIIINNYVNHFHNEGARGMQKAGKSPHLWPL